MLGHRDDQRGRAPRAPCRRCSRAAAASVSRSRSLALAHARARARAGRASRGGGRRSRPGGAASARPPSAIRAPRCARRLASSRSSSASSSSAEPKASSPSRFQIEVSRRRYGSSAFCSGGTSSTAPTRRVGARRARSTSPTTRASSRTSRRSSSRASAARLLERRLDRLGAGVRVAVEVAADPGAEAQRRRGAPGDELAQLARAAAARHPTGSPRRTRGPWRISSTTRGRCERTSSVCQRIVISSASSSRDRAPRRRRQLGVVELAQQRGDPAVLREDGPPRRLGRVRGQDELDRERPTASRSSLADRRSSARTRRRATRAACGPRARTARRRRSAVVLLGDVRELEVERERAQDERLPCSSVERRDARRSSRGASA